MSEIRQVRVDGINYDLVITEDEPSATRAEQAAQQAANSATQASTYATTAGDRAVAASGFAQDAEEAADRAEAIVGGEFVSYGQDQGLSEAEKSQARANIGVAVSDNRNLLHNWYFVGGGTAGKFPINQRGKNYYDVVNNYTIDRWKSVTLYQNSNTVKVATQAEGLGLAGNTNSQVTYVQFQQTIDNPPYGKEVTLSVLVDNVAADDDGNYPQMWGGSSAYVNITTTGLTKVTFTWPTTPTENYVRFVLYDGASQASSLRIQAVKLELGTVSTLINDVAPDYGEELTRCIYSKADPADTYANTGYSRSNYNLLDNSWFLVNSRGQTSYLNVGYTVDRWTADASLTITKVSDGVQFSTSTTYRSFRQKIANPSAFANKTVTISADIVSITGNFYVSAYTDSTLIQRASLSVGMNSVTITAPATGISEILFTNYATASTTAVIRSAKLELGTVSTLGNDAPPDYGEELTRCIYSKADPTDTYANNGFGRSNKNELDNPWWGVGEIVNQRGFTTGTGTTTTYPADRWICSYGSSQGTFTVTSSGIQITAASNSWCVIGQKMARPTEFVGKTITASIMLSNGTIISGTINVAALGSTQWVINASSAQPGWYIDLSGHHWIRLVQGTTFTIRAVKLELGSVSTLANDAPPNYAEELRKCQYYYRELVTNGTSSVSMVWAYSTVRASFANVFGVGNEMRVAPTVASSGTFQLQTQGGSLINVTSISRSSDATNSVTNLDVTVSSGLTQNQPCRLITNGSAKITFSADL